METHITRKRPPSAWQGTYDDLEDLLTTPADLLRVEDDELDHVSVQAGLRAGRGTNEVVTANPKDVRQRLESSATVPHWIELRSDSGRRSIEFTFRPLYGIAIDIEGDDAAWVKEVDRQLGDLLKAQKPEMSWLFHTWARVAVNAVVGMLLVWLTIRAGERLGITIEWSGAWYWYVALVLAGIGLGLAINVLYPELQLDGGGASSKRRRWLRGIFWVAGLLGSAAIAEFFFGS
ncbi:hypothetical protein [Gulosibacter faecalis]|uniref:hypothetical protein n=1 Tax=Gulosibacter faecalis TaxID=272240 RepID=UPI0012B58D68|nr:hypothetical protein [Gulosibacter faecalis]